MNKEYIYKDGKVLIIDDNNNEKEIDYYNNLDEVLVKENLIEKIEQEIISLEQELYGFGEIPKKTRFFHIWMPLLIFTIGPIIMFPALYYLCGFEGVVVPEVFSFMNPGIYMGIVSMPVFSMIGGILSGMCYYKEKDFDKIQKGKELELKRLKELLTIEKQDLEELLADKYKENQENNKKEDSFYVSRIDNTEMIRQLNFFKSLYYQLGYNEKKFFKYYQKGKLDEYFPSEYVEAINQHFKGKEKTLVKK